MTANDAAGGPTATPAIRLADSPASGASSAGATGSGGGVDAPDVVTRAAPDPSGAADKPARAVPPAVSARAAAAPPAKNKAVADARRAAPPGAMQGNASYQLQIKPWGVVYVDGVDRGTSPPVRRLALTPGRHTIRITHPNYRDSVLEFDSAPTTSNGKIIVDFDREGQ